MELNLTITEVCGATNCIMMEVGGATGSMMKCVELTESILINSSIR